MRKLIIFCSSLLFPLAVCAVELPDFTDLIEKTSPAVVKINTLARVEQTSAPYGNRQDAPEIFRDFFEFYGGPQQQGRSARSVGSGFIVSKDGYILTNNHVVEGATEIVVRLNDRQEYDAEIVGLDPQSDLALLKIEAKNLPTVAFADVDDLEVGDWVVAIGSPFDLDYSASAGIVSAIGRSLPNGTGQNYVPFIQTDVAINPGNSGGPLFNLDGEVVGINSQIYTRSGGYMGLSFAIPVSVALDVVSQLRDTGQVSRGWLGVSIQEVDRDLAKSFGLNRPHGALINQVLKGGPADQADLRPGDIILEFEGQSINYSYDLPHVVGLTTPGALASATIMRQGKELNIDVRVGELDSRGRRSVEASASQPRSNNLLGLVVTDMDPRVANRSGLSGGVIVQQVETGSPAEKAGLQRGDVIVQLGFAPIEDSSDYQNALTQLKQGDIVPIRFFRNRNSVYRTIEVD